MHQVEAEVALVLLRDGFIISLRGINSQVDISFLLSSRSLTSIY